MPTGCLSTARTSSFSSRSGSESATARALSRCGAFACAVAVWSIGACGSGEGDSETCYRKIGSSYPLQTGNIRSERLCIGDDVQYYSQFNRCPGCGNEYDEWILACTVYSEADILDEDTIEAAGNELSLCSRNNPERCTYWREDTLPDSYARTECMPPAGAGGPAARDAGGPDAWIEIGDGAAGFAEIRPGEEVPLILGPQGGWMMFFAVRGAGFNPGDPAIPNGPDNPVLLLGGAVAGRPVATLTVRRAFPPAAPPASFAIAGLPLVLDAGLVASDVTGRTLEVQAEVTDRDGMVLRATLEVVPVPADGAQ